MPIFWYIFINEVQTQKVRSSNPSSLWQGSTLLQIHQGCFHHIYFEIFGHPQHLYERTKITGGYEVMKIKNIPTSPKIQNIFAFSLYSFLYLIHLPLTAYLSHLPDSQYSLCTFHTRA